MHQPISGSIVSPLISAGPTVLPSLALSTGEAGERRRDQKIVAVEDAAQRIEDLAAHRLVGEILRKPSSFVRSRPSARIRAGNRRDGRARRSMPSRLNPSSAATWFGGMKRHQRSLSSRCERRMPISTSSTCAPASSNAATALSTTAMTRGSTGKMP